MEVRNRRSPPPLTRWVALFLAGAAMGICAALLAPVRADRAAA